MIEVNDMRAGVVVTCAGQAFWLAQDNAHPPELTRRDRALIRALLTEALAEIDDKEDGQ